MLIDRKFTKDPDSWHRVCPYCKAESGFPCVVPIGPASGTISGIVHAVRRHPTLRGRSFHAKSIYDPMHAFEVPEEDKAYLTHPSQRGRKMPDMAVIELPSGRQILGKEFNRYVGSAS